MDSATLFQKKRRPGELFLLAAIYGAAYFSVFLLLGIISYVFFRGFKFLNLRFFTTITSSYRGTAGIAGNLLNTLYIIVMTLLTAVPIGVGTAVYLNEYAENSRLTAVIEFALEVLAGIPSVIFGLFGMTFFGNVMGFGYSLLNGALTLSLMVLPLIVRNTQTALRAVPESYRCGALGLGAEKWTLIRTILLPAAMPGILSGIILAVGRIVGESAALLFTAGSARLLPKPGTGFLENISRMYDKIFESGGTLTVELYMQMQNGEYGIAFAIACVLILTVLVINFLLKILCRLVNVSRYGAFPAREDGENEKR